MENLKSQHNDILDTLHLGRALTPSSPLRERAAFLNYVYQTINILQQKHRTREDFTNQPDFVLTRFFGLQYF